MIGMILKNMRLRSKMFQKSLGKKVNFADTTISSYERENSHPDFNAILRISKICGYEILFRDKENNLISANELSKGKDY